MIKSRTLVSSQDVEGTEVFSRESRHSIGQIHHLIIDKASGRIAYADMSFGGFLGIGEGHYPIPWNALQYDADRGGFVTDITEAQLKSAPSYDDGRWEDESWEKQLHDYYGAPVYWGSSGGADTAAGADLVRELDQPR